MADTVFDPVPESGTLCGLLGSLSVNTRVADSAALTEGVNVTPTVQVVPPATLLPQVFEPEAIAKSVAGAAGEIGTTVMLVKVTVLVVLLVTVTVCGAVATPIACVPKLILVGDTVRLPTKGSSATNAFAVAVPPPPSVFWNAVDDTNMSGAAI
jgi:hypothetical protein